MIGIDFKIETLIIHGFVMPNYITIHRINAYLKWNTVLNVFLNIK